MSLDNPPAGIVSAAGSRRPVYAHDGQHSTRLLLLRRLASRRRVTGLTLAAAGWAATFAAVIAGSQLGRGGAVQIAFAATMISVAMGETLLFPVGPVITEDRGLVGKGRCKRIGTMALVTACLLGPAAGGAVLGAGWGTSVLTALAVACALASLAAHRLNSRWHQGWRLMRAQNTAARHPAAGRHRAAERTNTSR